MLCVVHVLCLCYDIVRMEGGVRCEVWTLLVLSACMWRVHLLQRILAVASGL